MVIGPISYPLLEILSARDDSILHHYSYLSTKPHLPTSHTLILVSSVWNSESASDMKIVNLALRGVQFLLAIITLALVANIIHDAFAGNPSIINYTIFIIVFALLSLIYLIAAAVNESFAINPVFVLAVDAINTLLFFCGAVALAAQLKVHSCGNDVSAFDPDLEAALTDTRDTLSRILLRMEGTIEASAAMRLRLSVLSYGSSLPPSLEPRSCRSST